MANLKETAEWIAGIYQLEKNDAVVGGADGIDNRQAIQLAARTNFLKNHVTDLESGKTPAGRATQLATNRTIHINGDATGSAEFNGAKDVEITLLQKDSGIEPGKYRQVEVDGKGRVISGTNPTTLAGFGITDDIAIKSWVHGLNYEQRIEGALALAEYANLPQGTRMPFAQAAAPTGWTQVTDDTASNRMLRVVTGVGGGTGGIHNPMINHVVAAHTHTFTTGNISADHTHTIYDPGHTHGVTDPGHMHSISVRSRNASGSGVSDSGDKVTYNSTTNYSATGISLQGAQTGIIASGVTSNHTHSGATDNGSSATNWEPRYIDMIICVKN